MPVKFEIMANDSGISMQKKHVERIGSASSPTPLWIESLATASRLAQPEAECKVRTRLTFDMRAGKPSLFVPPDMAELQPASLRYLRALAQRHKLMLVEDQRRVEVSPTVDKRNKQAPMIATGISLLMKQTGLPGIAKALSNPHRLQDDSACIPMPQLIRMAARAANKSKQVVVLPNRMLVSVLNNNTQPIVGYACKAVSDEGNTVLCHYDSSTFRAIGYSTGEQYVMQLCLAGGPLRMPSIWSDFHTLARTEFQLQLFPGKQPGCDFGLLYATYYLDMAQSPKPWWLTSDFMGNNAVVTNGDTAQQRKAS